MRHSDYPKILELCDYLVDDQYGVIKEVRELPVMPGEPDFFHYYSESCNTARFTSLRNFSYNGGVSTSRPLAVAKALGEAVERYCSAIFRFEDLQFSSFCELEERATPPDRFALYLDWQYQKGNIYWQPFTENSKIYWARGQSLVSGESVYAPAAMVYIPYIYYIKSGGDTPICQPISTGLACHENLARSILGSLYEAIERDSFNIMWQAMLSMPKINHDSLPEAAMDVLNRIKAASVDAVEIIDITTDIGCPTIMTIARSDHELAPALTFSAATDLSAEKALIKSLEELVHTRRYSAQVKQYMQPVAIEEGHPGIERREQHIHFYALDYTTHLAEFAYASDKVIDFSEVANYDLDPVSGVKTLASLLDKAGLEPIIYDLTSPDIRPLGLYVTRAVVPGLQPLFMGYKNRALSGSRLYEVPPKLGYKGIRRGESDNPSPHPFP